MLRDILLVFIGSGVGGSLRFVISRLLASFIASAYPWGTFVVNVLGCFIIGLVNGWFNNGSIPDTNVKLLLTVGFCGGFTTFSSFMNENLTLLRADNFPIFIAYSALSLILGMLSLWLGYYLSK